MLKKITVIVIIIMALIIIIGLIKQIITALGSDKRFEQSLEEVNKLERENKQLKKELTFSDSLESVEEIARDNLNMALENETIVIIPKDLIDKILTPIKKPEEFKIPYWQGWLRLFIH